MTNLKEIFADKKVFIPFVVADDPDIETTVQSILTLAENGADIIELGVPFSDPVADGPVIQKADLRAFAAGVNRNIVFEIVEKVRQTSDVPIIFDTYLNIPFKYGYDKFCQKCQELNVAGLIIPDAPIEEQAELKPFADKYGIDLVPTVAPTSAGRTEKLAQAATGFIYVISIFGAAGVSDELATQQLQVTVQQIRAVSDVPIVTATEQVEKVAGLVDGILSENAVVKIIADGGDVQKNLKEYVLNINNTMRINAL
ncbi:tryptophan synthase subunit alpha [Companilactobacillus huachuanensis]|uniref:Tryptophan synthase alpha chain n=1 Tax=Companilactobacillus huachuanensis TaxID=2559914 RepID=A0ABW1RJL6_9LACO|nr:tryptophan synthase subunit alpha [Companilactobacillus huachuanensis]